MIQFACLAFKSKKIVLSSFLTISNQKTAFFVRKGRKSCQLCPGAFTSDLAYYYHHFRSHRPKSEILDCKVCGKTAKNMMMFKRHVLGWDFSKKMTASLHLDLSPETIMCDLLSKLCKFTKWSCMKIVVVLSENSCHFVKLLNFTKRSHNSDYKLSHRASA